MSIYKIRNLGKLGVVTDIPPYDLPIEGWVNANNVRFIANRVEKLGGFTPAMQPTKDDSIPLVFCQEPESDALIFGTQKNIYRYSDSQVFEISKSHNAYSVDVSEPWDYTFLSNCVVFNDPRSIPQGWLAGAAATTGKLMQDLPGWGYPNEITATTPSGGIDWSKGTHHNWSCNRMKSYKSYLIALNMNEDGKRLPQRIRWSDAADVNAFPPNWFEDGQSSDGAFVDLADCTGSIIDGRPLRDYFLIYTDRETYIMRFVGGEFVFDIQKLFPDAGVLNANCVCEFEGGNHFVISQDDIFTHDGSTRQSIVTDIIKEKLLGEITSINYQGAKVFPFTTRKEIWVCYPSMASEEGSDKNYACDRAAIWNWKTGAWSFCDLPGTYWLNEVTTPDNDTRAWLFPDRSGTNPVKPITKITLDSPIYSLAVGDTFRMDVIYQPGEGFTGANNETMTWDTNHHNIATFDATGLDGSANITGKAPGVVTMTVKYHRPQTGNPGDPNYLPALDLTDTYNITIVAQTVPPTPPGDRHQASDVGHTVDPNEPSPPRPDQVDDPDNQWPDPLGENGTAHSNQHDNEQWEKKGYSFSSKSFIGCSEDHNFYFIDTGTRQIRYDKLSNITSDTPVVAELTKYGIAFSDVEDGLYRHKTFRTIYPLMSGEGTLRFNIGGSNDAYDQPVYKETKQFLIGTDYKIDCFSNYRYLAYKIRDEGEGKWSLSGMDVDFFFGGNR